MSEIITAAERVRIARQAGRPVAKEYIDAIFDDFIPMAGDRKMGEDESIMGGPALFHGVPVMVISQQKGADLDEKVRYRFGMPNPEGYRKAERLMKHAEKFNMPVITFVDTPGAYPGKEAEERGQGEAIARSIATMSTIEVPVISVFIGEGGSGGALAIGVADITIMLENAIFSILSPEGFATILWKDSTRWEEAAEVMKLTAADLQELGIVDIIVSEKDRKTGENGAHINPEQMFRRVEIAVADSLEALIDKKGSALADSRYKKLRAIGMGTRVEDADEER